MKITGDQQLIKKMNKSIVLDTIRQRQPLSRADISAGIGLNKATVSSLVSELIDSRLVTEIGPGESSGGRKPTLLLFNKQAGFAIGVDIRVSDLLAVLVDLEGSVIREKSVPLTDFTPENVVDQIGKTIRLLSRRLPDSPYGIVGIGIGVPGLVDETSRVVSAPNLGWDNVDLAGALAAEFGGNLHIDNEANAGAIGEKLYGAGRDSQNLIYLSIGVGIGSGIIVGGALYRGTSNFSGEVGHMTVAEDGPLCRCGNRGCWETLASEKALLDRAAGIWRDHTPGLEQILDAGKRGDKQALDLLNEIGSQLGVGLANLVNILNPELIVIGNRLSLAGELFEEAMLQTIKNRSLSYHRKKTHVDFAKLGIRSTALGAASMPITAFLTDPDVSVRELS
ncbi:ROK family protein [Paenibacillus sp. alder61]|uniref:ROK family transcriptional regulator n=1 Tax=Paenibacillus faecis TaxID=862114 RepID=A0A5D0CN41_9BACL|nr:MULTISPECIES: ROK family transcriptional regulator [Paenibacillus]MCA1294887.1 ROK family protein [Paenibacillus sp. alder61]TYA11443.1 ROK family transcriptional regulator [Paenibacillus faecis]